MLVHFFCYILNQCCVVISYDGSVISTDEDAAVSFLKEKDLVHNPRQCGNGHDMILALGQQQRWCCNKKTCREYKPVCKDTFLEGSRLPLRTIIKFIYDWYEGRSSVKNSKNQLKIDNITHTHWTAYLRHICAEDIMSNPKKIGGPNFNS